MAAQPNAKQQIEEQLSGILTRLVEGAAEDIQKFAAEIADRTIAISTLPSAETRERKMKQVEAQLAGLAEINRIRANNEAWALTQEVTSTAVRIGVAALISAI